MILTIFTKSYFFLIQNSKHITAQEAEEFKRQAQILELSRLTTILSIALVTVLILLAINIYKNQVLKQEIKNLKA